MIVGFLLSISFATTAAIYDHYKIAAVIASRETQEQR